MRKDLGVKPAVYPMPVLMVATYDENGVVDVMNAAWGNDLRQRQNYACAYRNS